MREVTNEPTLESSELMKDLSVKYVETLEAYDKLKKEFDIVNSRYEYVRTLNVQQFSEVWKENIDYGTPFDELIDDRVGF